MKLQEQLKMIETMFRPQEGKYPTYLFTLGLFGNKERTWCLKLIDSWHDWRDKNYDVEFYGRTPEEATQSFLNYVDVNNINVKKLQEKY